jgi:hypothetical protein
MRRREANTSRAPAPTRPPPSGSCKSAELPVAGNLSPGVELVPNSALTRPHIVTGASTETLTALPAATPSPDDVEFVSSATAAVPLTSSSAAARSADFASFVDEVLHRVGY